VRRSKLPCGPLSIYRRYRRRSLLAFSSRCDLSRPKAEITEADAHQDTSLHCPHFLGGLLRARSGVVSQGRGFWQVGRRKPSRKHLKSEAELPFEKDDWYSIKRQTCIRKVTLPNRASAAFDRPSTSTLFCP
jgi:hypothetical protein